MFLRKKPNKSGSTSVQVIVKTKNRKQRVVKTIGSSRATDEIERLMAEGKKYISDQNGPLFPGIDEDETAVDTFVGSLTNSHIKVVGPELIFGRLYDYIGFNSIPSEMFRHMVICRLFNPGSKLKTVDYLERYLHVSYDISKIYRFLDNLCYRKDTKFEADAAWDGIKGYVTNTRLTPEKSSIRMAICCLSSAPSVLTNLTWLSVRYTTDYLTALRDTSASASRPIRYCWSWNEY